MIELIFPKKYSALCLKSAFFGFFAHTGFVRGLQEIGFKPAIVTGSSSGAMIGALYATGKEMLEFESVVLRLKKKDFWEGNSLTLLGRFLKKGWNQSSGVLTGKATRKILYPYLGNKKFSELPIKLGIAVSNLSKNKRELITEGNVLDAVMASIAFPFLYEVQEFEGQEFLDGGIGDGEPIKELIMDPSIDRIVIHQINNHRPVSKNILKRALDASVQIIESETEDLKTLLAKEKGKKLIRLETNTPYLSPNDFSNGKFALAEGRGTAYKNKAEILGDMELPIFGMFN
ncbi:patatin-like phospholipase family protein [Leptospira jelokensis]|uniref:patatin-like phospholipase family protein n=1 Tax=Leptospira jelokensis TaxID=2484931 RepID=UPI00109126B7|nr:patatin-like phospholipase family protein [Leptospira jelokensis]TGM05052.1 alpha/beta hydrolase [Leptospira jelokensis]